MRAGNRRRGVELVCACLLATVISGCAATYSRTMKGPLKRLQQRNYEGALGKLEKPSGKTNKLLYRLEKGLILHYQGAYEASNVEFEKAERLIEKLYTRSASREVAALITNDAIRPYTGEEFERALIHYYRALNYHFLDNWQDALVECRKANLRLQAFAARAEYELSYKNDAFLQYMTGLFFEAEQEWNDAYISYKDALKGYDAYQEAFGLAPPPALVGDMVQLAFRLGYEDEAADYARRYGLEAPYVRVSGDGSEVTIFAESGFIARKGQNEIDIPILEADDTRRVWHVSDRMVYRYHHPYRHTHGKVDYWLRLAVPEYRESPTRVSAVRLTAGDQSSNAVMAEDLNAIAAKSFGEKMDTILLRTAARALAKYTATRAAEKKSEVLGWLVNFLGVSTEAADTRSWLSLPGAIWVGRITLPPGTHDVLLEFLDPNGGVVEAHTFTSLHLKPGEPAILSYRCFK